MKVLRRLSSGALADVLLAQTASAAQVQLTVVKKEIAADTAATARFLETARAVRALTHPGLRRVLKAGRLADGRPYVMTETVDGESLAARLKEGTLSAAEVASLGATLADALAEAHAAGVVHGDLTAESVQLTGDGVVLAGFGLAAFTRPAPLPDAVEDRAALAAVLLAAAGIAVPPSGEAAALPAGADALAALVARLTGVTARVAEAAHPPPPPAAAEEEDDEEEEEREAAEAPSAWPSPGARVGAWELGEAVTPGDATRSFRARHALLGSEAEVELAARGADAAASAQVLDRARAASRVRSEHVAVVFDAGEWDGRAWVAREPPAGAPLAVAKELPARAAALVRQVCAALSSAHEAGVAHGPFSPDDVLVDAKDHVRLRGFGAPGAAQKDDVAAAGALLAGLVESPSPALAELIARSTAPDAAARPTAAELGAALDAFLAPPAASSSAPQVAAATPSAVPAPAAAKTRSSGRVVGVALVALVAGAALGFGGAQALRPAPLPVSGPLASGGPETPPPASEPAAPLTPSPAAAAPAPAATEVGPPVVPPTAAPPIAAPPAEARPPEPKPAEPAAPAARAEPKPEPKKPTKPKPAKPAEAKPKAAAPAQPAEKPDPTSEGASPADVVDPFAN